KNRTPVISKNVRRRGQRFPSGSEKTNGVTPGGRFSGICTLICVDYEEVRTRNKRVILSENASPAWTEGSRCAHEILHFSRPNLSVRVPSSTPALSTTTCSSGWGQSFLMGRRSALALSSAQMPWSLSEQRYRLVP